VRESLSERAHVGIAIGFAILYFAWSLASRGFFQDDEVGHFLESVHFWEEPASILGPWSRPGFKLLCIVPALLGLRAVHVLGCLLAAGAVYVTGRLSREMGLPNRLLIAVLCGCQPLFLQLSFRTYAEIPGALLLALALLFHHRKKPNAAAFVLSYLFTVRQETVVLWIAFAALLAWQRRFGAILILVWAPASLAALGALANGDPLWLVHGFLRGGKNPGFAKPDPLHYVRAFVPIFGVPASALLLAGLARFVPSRPWADPAPRTRLVLYGAFVAMFTLNVVLSATEGVTPALGIWRNLLLLSPFVALLAGIGAETLAGTDARASRTTLLVVAALVASVLAFGSHAHNYFAYQEARDYTRFIVGLVLLGGLLALRARHSPAAAIGLFLGVITIGGTLISERPLRLSEEHALMREVVRFHQSSGLGSRPTLVNHPMFDYFERASGRRRPKPGVITMQTIRAAKPGTIIVWDTHYGYRPELNTDAHFDSLSKDPSLHLVREFVADTLLFSVVVVEKR
jgi:hypothetical protein